MDANIDSYFTLAQACQGEYKEKGSKFLAFAFPIHSEESIKSTLEQVRKEYFDARHHCYAYTLGFPQESTRTNDDGEPTNTAGTPILGQIRARDLKNTLLIVVRYFGGVKLGVGGLIQAYKSASAEALTHAIIIEKSIFTKIKLAFPYSQMNTVMRMVKDYELDILHQTMLEACELQVGIRISKIEILAKKLESLSYEGISYQKIPETYAK
jgi:uncharacterized YigZ family protein